MKRRSFIVVSLLSLLGVSVFSFFRWIHGSNLIEVLAQPKFLSLLCDDNTIRLLGRAYLKIKPAENISQILLSGLTEHTLKKNEKQEVSLIESQIEKRVVQDFDEGIVIVVQGWVLSITEARQCAFFSTLSD